MEETVLREQLRTVDESLLFLLLIVLSVLLSYWGVRIQREGLCRTLQGDAEGAAAPAPGVPHPLSASALVVGALGFFLCLALKTEAGGPPGVGRRRPGGRRAPTCGPPCLSFSPPCCGWTTCWAPGMPRGRSSEIKQARPAARLSRMRVSLPAPWQKRYKPRWPPSGPCRR